MPIQNFQLVPFNLAKAHLNIISNDRDADIRTKLQLASAVVMNHCKLKSIPRSWVLDPTDTVDELIITIGEILQSPPDSPPNFDSPPDSPPDSSHVRVPGVMQLAVLLVLGDIFEKRESSTSDLLSDAVKDLLTPYRDPTQA